MSKINPYEITTIYGAKAVFLGEDDLAAELHCQPIPVLDFVPNFGESFEVEGVHYVSSNYRSSFIPIHMLNKEHKVGENQYTFFSEDMTKCIAWLETMKKKMMDYHLSQYEQLKNIPIEIEEEYSSISLAR